MLFLLALAFIFILVNKLYLLTKVLLSHLKNMPRGFQTVAPRSFRYLPLEALLLRFLASVPFLLLFLLTNKFQ